MVARTFLKRAGGPAALFLLAVLHCYGEVEAFADERNSTSFARHEGSGTPEQAPSDFLSSGQLNEASHEFVLQAHTSEALVQDGDNERQTKPHPCSPLLNGGHPCPTTEHPAIFRVVSKVAAADGAQDVHQIQPVSSPCLSTAGVQNGLGLLERLFAPACPSHWRPIASAMPSMNAEGNRRQVGEEYHKTLEHAPPPGVKETIRLLPHELRLYSHPLVLTIGETATVSAELLDSKGQLVPTDCGSVSLQLLQQGAEPVADTAEPTVSGLGPQLLKGGRATWQLIFFGGGYSFIALEAIPRLCTWSTAEGLLLLDTPPDAQLLQPAIIVLEVHMPQRGPPSTSGGADASLDGEIQPQGGGRPHLQGAETVIATVELQTTSTEMTEAVEACRSTHEQIRQTSPLLGASSERLPEPELAAANEKCNDCSRLQFSGSADVGAISKQQPTEEAPCDPLTLILHSRASVVTAEHPAFGYSLKLSRRPLTPVTVALIPRLESSPIRAKITTLHSHSPLDALGSAAPNNEALQLLVGGELQTPGHTITIAAEEWNQPIAVEVQLSLAAAATAAAAVESGRAPVQLHVEHRLSALGLGDNDDGKELQEMPEASLPPALAVSAQCKVHTYFDDAAAGWPEDVASVLPRRPVSVRCTVRPSSDVSGEVRVTVTAGNSLRLISPAPGTELVLMRRQSRGSDDMDDEASREKTGETTPSDALCLEDTCIENKATSVARDSQLEWDRAEVLAIVLPEASGCAEFSCTISFDLGSRDERRGGDLRMLPMGGKVATFPESHSSHRKRLDEEAAGRRSRVRLLRPWSLMPMNVARTQIRVFGGPAAVGEVLAACLVATCSGPGNHPVEAGVRCVAPKRLNNAYVEGDTIDIYVQLAPAVTSNCQLLDSSGTSIGTFQAVATTSTSCGDGTFYSRDTGACQPCPHGFRCSDGRLFQCARPVEDGPAGVNQRDCSLCPEGKE